jgi:hypothetical protein
MNEANRTAIVLLAAAWIVLMAIIIFLTWAAPGDTTNTLGDIVQEMDANNDTAGRLILTLGALALAVFGLLVIILELAPEDEERELHVKQAGSTTIVPAQALRLRLEEALAALPEVTTAKARVWTRDNGIATNLDLGLIPRANVANVTQESSRIVVDIIQTELGLPVAGLPNVRVSFGGEKPLPVTAAAMSPVTAASSIVRPPERQPETDPREVLGGAEDAPPAEPAVIDATEGTADASPGPLVYGEPQASEEVAPAASEASEHPTGAPEATEPAEPAPETAPRDAGGPAAATPEPPAPDPNESPEEPSLRSRLFGPEPEKRSDDESSGGSRP